MTFHPAKPAGTVMHASVTCSPFSVAAASSWLPPSLENFAQQMGSYFAAEILCLPLSAPSRTPRRDSVQPVTQECKQLPLATKLGCVCSLRYRAVCGSR